MSTTVIALLLALSWLAMTGSVTIANFLFGLALSCLALLLVRGRVEGRQMPRPGRIALLALLFFRELALSAWRVAVLVLKPKIDITPAIFAYPLRVKTDLEITLLANLITLTPGTLSVDVSEDRQILYVHAIDCPDADAARRDIADGFERHILEAFR